MGSTSFDVGMNVNDCFRRVQEILGNAGFEVRDIEPNRKIIAEKGRDFKWLWLILLIIIFWPLAIVYYFTRPKNTVSVSFEEKNGGCRVSVVSTGRKGEEVMNVLKSSLR